MANIHTRHGSLDRAVLWSEGSFRSTSGASVHKGVPKVLR